MDPDRPESEAVRAARKRRHSLLDAARGLEASSSGPAADPDWRPEVAACLDDLAAALADHTAETEGPGGILEEMLSEAPRLANAISRLRAEHVELDTRIAELRERVTSGGVAEEIRGDILSLLGVISRHRQRGSDLVYEAYKIDIGGG